MAEADRTVDGIKKEKRRAVRIIGDERDARLVRDKAVHALAILRARDAHAAVGNRHAADLRMMILCRSSQCIKGKTGGIAETPEIFLHMFPRVSAAEIQVHGGERAFAHAANPCGKRVAHAGKRVPGREREPAHAVFLLIGHLPHRDLSHIAVPFSHEIYRFFFLSSILCVRIFCSGHAGTKCSGIKPCSGTEAARSFFIVPQHGMQRKRPKNS